MIWFDGAIVSRAQLDASAAGALLGWGVFSTLAIRAGRPLFWEQHAARLERDAAAARDELPWSAAQLRADLDELIARQNIECGLARISGLKRGDGRWNPDTGAHWLMLAHGAPPQNSAPLWLQVSPYRVAAHAPLAGVKTTSYLSYFVAWEQARGGGFDEALLLTESGWVCESARASVFWVRDGALYTPSPQCGCLRGVGRQIVLENFAAQEGRWPLSALWQADEAFVVSGASGVRPIGALSDGNQTRQWNEIGMLTARIQAKFWEL